MPIVSFRFRALQAPIDRSPTRFSCEISSVLFQRFVSDLSQVIILGGFYAPFFMVIAQIFKTSPLSSFQLCDIFRGYEFSSTSHVP